MKSPARIPVLAFHQVTDDFSWSITRQKLGQFERGIGFLQQQGYKAVPLSHMNRDNQNLDDKIAALTFDDGYEDFYLNAYPILRKYGFYACVFIVTGYVGQKSDWDYSWGRYRKRHMDWSQLVEISGAGFEIGSHTVNHPDLTKIPPPYLTYELKESKRVLEDKLNRRVDFLSYPFGRYNWQVQDEAEKSGYQRAFALGAVSPGAKHRVFSVPRRGVYLLDSPLTLMAKVKQNRMYWAEEMKGWIINRFPGWTIMLKGSPDYDSLKPVE